MPDATFEQVRRVADEMRQSVSSLITTFTVRGLGQMGNPFKLETDATTGLPVISIGRPITAQEVAEAIAE